jgi:hypothetical protein
MTRSVITEAAAWLIEHPSASYDTSLERLAQTRVVGAAVVVEDDLLVQAVEVHTGSPAKRERSEWFVGV